MYGFHVTTIEYHFHSQYSERRITQRIHMERVVAKRVHT